MNISSLNDNSAQLCGCDKGCGGYECEQHQAVNSIGPIYKPVSGPIEAKPGPTRASSLPTSPEARKQHPIASGVMDYFPDALVAISNVSWKGNEQHNPGEPLHWARGKSTDEADKMIRHFLQRGSLDSDGLRHTAKMVWRALALLQKEIESESPNCV